MNIPVATPKISENKQRPLIEAGTYPARIVQIIDLGTVEKVWQGNVSIDRTYAIRFETPDESAVFVEEKGKQPFLFTEDVKNKITSKDSEMKSKLDKIILAVGDTPSRDYNIFNLLDKTLLIEINQKQANNGKIYNNITSFTKLPKGMSVSERVNELKALSLDPEYFDRDVFDSISEYTQNKIKESAEYALLTNTKNESKLTMSAPANQPLPAVEEIDLEDVNLQMPF